jgi:predicted transcriptional regulator of viral defense system
VTKGWRVFSEPPSRVHLTVPNDARLRRRKPKWIVIHRGNLPPSDMATHEGLPVTTVAKSVLDVMEATGGLGVARQAIKDARKEGYITAAELNRLMRQLNHHAHGGGAARSMRRRERKARSAAA